MRAPSTTPGDQILKTQFEYNFFPGASGQIGYELFVKRRPKDGHNLLFGNMGPEMIMYTTQKPDYNFPRDFIYFSMVDIDDSIVFASRTSPYKIHRAGRRRGEEARRSTSR